MRRHVSVGIAGGLEGTQLQHYQVLGVIRCWAAFGCCIARLSPWQQRSFYRTLNSDMFGFTPQICHSQFILCPICSASEFQQVSIMLGWGTWAKFQSPRKADRSDYHVSTRLGFEHKNLVPQSHILVAADFGICVV